uniref:Dynein, light chain, Tctex-type 1 n=1 Tax=Nothobranchius korthausae TaxID=1143690 RepID=A0A1A8FVH0_9TELE
MAEVYPIPLNGALERIAKDVFETTIGGSSYQQSRVNQWTTMVIEQCLSQLSSLRPPFKYIVSCAIMEKTGAGLQAANSCFWNNSTDETSTVHWENNSMHCILTVFSMAI